MVNHATAIKTTTAITTPFTASLMIVLGTTLATAAPNKDPFSVVSVTSHENAFDRPHDIELSGDLAFVPGKGGSLAILDVRNPEAPQLLWHRHDPKRLDEAETVLVAQDRLLLGTHDFISIDIANPRQPTFQCRVSDRPGISHINGMVRRGTTVFAAGKNGWISAFDVSDPDAPTRLAALNLREKHDIGSPHDVDLFAEYAVVPDPRGFGRREEPGKLGLLRVFDDQTGQLLPAEHWELTGAVASEQLVGANRVQVAGPYALVGASTAGDRGRLVVIDLSQPHSPRQLASLPFAPDDGWGPNGLTVAGDVVFLAGGQSVEAIDIRRPEHPAKLASQRFASQLPGGRDSGHDLVYRDGYLYVTGQNDHCLMILRAESKRIRQLAE